MDKDDKDKQGSGNETLDELDALLEDAGFPMEPDKDENVSAFPIKQNRAALLGMAPPDKPRIRVRDIDGNLRWKNMAKLDPDDVIVLDRFGKPSFARKPGRPKKKSSKKPNVPGGMSKEEHLKVKARLRKKTKFVKNNPLVQAAMSNPDALESLQHVMVAFSEEAAGAEFLRNEAEERGEDGGKFSNQRVRYLRYFSETWLQHKELRQNANEDEQGVDIESPSFRAVFLFIIETFRDVLMDMKGLDSRTVQLILTKFSKEVQSEEWSQKAKKKVQQALDT